MKLISLLLSFCLTFNVMAASGAISELERQLDDYHYALTVEWDQKDQQFYEEKTADFFKNVKKLIEKDGLTQKQVLTFLEKKSNNKLAINAISLRMSFLNKSSSVTDLSELIKETANELYSKGASWNGEVALITGLGLVAIAAIGYAVWYSATHECARYQQEYVCNTYSNCGFYSGSFGASTSRMYCENYRFTNTTTTCGYTDVCAEYKRK